MTRSNELDAMRGILLLIMAVTHLPTGLNPYADQPLGYVSSAEGFVFLSAFLVGSIYSQLLRERGLAHVRQRLWQRARQLYGYHLALLVFVFTIVAAIAHFMHSVALHNYLLFFFHSPGWALVSAPLLFYQPPLLDILPMYVVFLALTPLLLQGASRRGWWPIVLLSALLWLSAQLHTGAWLSATVLKTRLPVPPVAWGAFDWLAWQLVWVTGVWLGSQHRMRAAPASAPASADRRTWRYVMIVALPAAVVLLCTRHHLGGLFAQLDVNSPWVDKWKLGPLRVANFAALGVIAGYTLLPALRWLRISALELLGRSSLQVFTAHIPVCILADGLMEVGSTRLTVAKQVFLLPLMLAIMLLVAWHSDRPRRHGAVQRSAIAVAKPVQWG